MIQIQCAANLFSKLSSRTVVFASGVLRELHLAQVNNLIRQNQIITVGFSRAVVSSSWAATV